MEPLLKYIQERGTFVHGKIQGSQAPTDEQLQKFVCATVENLKKLSANAPEHVQQKIVWPWAPLWDWASNSPGQAGLDAPKLLAILKQIKDSLAVGPAAKGASKAAARDSSAPGEATPLAIKGASKAAVEASWAAKARASGYPSNVSSKNASVLQPKRGHVVITVSSALSGDVLTELRVLQHAMFIHIKADLEIRVHVPKSEIILLSEAGEAFDDKTTLAEAGLKDGSVIQLARSQPDSYADLVPLLMKAGADCMHKIKQGSLSTVTEVEMIRISFLLQAKANGSNVNEPCENGTGGWWSTLHCLVHAGMLEESQLLLDDEEFTSMNVKSDYCFTNPVPSGVAALTGAATPCYSVGTGFAPSYLRKSNSHLLGHQFSPNLQKYTCTALHVAVLNHQVELCKLLLSHERFEAVNDLSEWYNGRFRHTALHMAVVENAADIVEIILRAPRFTAHNAVDNDENTALHLCAMWGDAKIARMLLEAPEFTLADSTKPSQLLCERSYSMNVCSKDLLLVYDVTALHCAVIANNAMVCDALLESSRFTEVNTKTTDRGHAYDWRCSLAGKGFTALHCAAYTGNSDIAAVLLKSDRVDVNATSDDGCTALHVAACLHNGNQDSIKLKMQPWQVARHLRFCEELLRCMHFIMKDARNAHKRTALDIWLAETTRYHNIPDIAKKLKDLLAGASQLDKTSSGSQEQS